MSGGMDCATVRELAPDLALGIADGDERAAALAHVTQCAACRRILDSYAVTADALLLAAPSIEPPDGFESRVFFALEGERARPPRRSRILMAVAVAAAVFVIGLAVGLSQRTTATAHVDRAGAVTDARGQSVGRVYSHDGDPSLLVIRMNASAPPGTYRVECEYEAGDSYMAGLLKSTGGSLTWGKTVPVPLDQLTRVHLERVGGGPDLAAPMSST